ncbi:hypothetical protein BDR22DRAFT_714146 [Usnea florida]
MFSGMTPPDDTSYWGEYSPRNGLITALSTHKFPGDTLFWSDAAFALWQAISALKHTNVKNIRYIVQDDILNEITRAIVFQAVPDRSKEIAIFNHGTEEFQALLGTPNSAGGVYLLMEHKGVLGLKTISRIFVFLDRTADPGEEWVGIVYEVQNMPSSKDAQEVVKDGNGLSQSGFTLSLIHFNATCHALNSSIAGMIANS